jgi:hypothetical protein
VAHGTPEGLHPLTLLCWMLLLLPVLLLLLLLPAQL